MLSLYELLDTLLSLYSIVIIARIILEWLVIFGIVDRFNNIVASLGRFLFAMTEPAFNLLRRSLGRFVPLQVAAVDLVPLVVLLLLWFVRNLLSELWVAFL